MYVFYWKKIRTNIENSNKRYKMDEYLIYKWNIWYKSGIKSRSISKLIDLIFICFMTNTFCNVGNKLLLVHYFHMFYDEYILKCGKQTSLGPLFPYVLWRIHSAMWETNFPWSIASFWLSLTLKLNDNVTHSRVGEPGSLHFDTSHGIWNCLRH